MASYRGKIKPEHADPLVAAVQANDTAENRAIYAAAGLSDMRYRWDLLWLAHQYDIIRAVYEYADDTHIDTLLRWAVAPLEAR